MSYEDDETECPYNAYGRRILPAPPYLGPAPGGLAERALELRHKTSPPRDYLAENAVGGLVH